MTAARRSAARSGPPLAPSGGWCPLTAGEIATTAAAIAAVQLPSGLIPFYPGGAADPWNHVEAAMALDTAGRHDAARAAYRFVLSEQRGDGSLPAQFLTAADSGATRSDTNAVAYLATGCLHHVLSTKDVRFAVAAFPAVAGAIDFVLRQQRDDGAIRWSVDAAADGSALLAASSAIHLSLRAAVQLAELAGEPRPAWDDRRRALRAAIRDSDGDRFLDKSSFAMDWYYPVLSGALPAPVARRRLGARWEEFAGTGHGVRCRADERWVTSAETAECTLALLRVGEEELARGLFATLADKRLPSGAYRTGLVYPERSEFPLGESTTYSAAAVLLAADALRGGAATSSVFGITASSTRRLAQPAASSSTKRPDRSASR
jgi:hypothetical protein